MSSLTERQREYASGALSQVAVTKLNDVSRHDTLIANRATAMIERDVASMEDAINLLDGDSVWFRLQAFRDRDFNAEAASQESAQ